MNEDSMVLDDRQKIISKLTAARIEKGISQQELADRIGTKRSNICRIESGAQNISLDMLLKIARALGKDVRVTLKDRESAGESKYTKTPKNMPELEPIPAESSTSPSAARSWARSSETSFAV